MEIHIGQWLKEVMKKERIGAYTLAHRIGRNPTAIYTQFKSKNASVYTLWRYTVALKYNFFMDLANLMPKEYSYAAAFESEKELKIKQLEEDIKNLKAQLEVLKEVIRK